MRLSDEDLTVLVDRAAEGAWNSRVANSFPEGFLYADLDRAKQNELREEALPYIFHGTQALADLGFRKPRTVGSIKELDTLPAATVVMSANGAYFGKTHADASYWNRIGAEGPFHPGWIKLPATVLHEGDAS